MNKKELINTIRDGLQIDFNAKSTGTGAIILVRENENNYEQIIFSYSKFPGEYVLGASISGWKSINAVENILTKYFQKNNINQPLVTIQNKSERIEGLSELPIRNKEDILKVLPSLKKMVFDNIITFFESYNSIEKIHHYANVLDEANLTEFIFNPPRPRMMIIKRLVKAPDWEEYCERVIKIYKEQSEGKYKAAFFPIYQFLPALFQELKDLS